MPFLTYSYLAHTKKRTHLRNRYHQHNFCVSLSKKKQKIHYANLNHKNIADWKQF